MSAALFYIKKVHIYFCTEIEMKTIHMHSAKIGVSVQNRIIINSHKYVFHGLHCHYNRMLVIFVVIIKKNKPNATWWSCAPIDKVKRIINSLPVLDYCIITL